MISTYKHNRRREITERQSKLWRFIDFAELHFRMFPGVLKGRARPDRIAHPRMATMGAARACLECTLVEIGEAFGRDHGTVIHAIKRCGDPKIGKLRDELLRAWAVHQATPEYQI